MRRPKALFLSCFIAFVFQFLLLDVVQETKCCSAQSPSTIAEIAIAVSSTSDGVELFNALTGRHLAYRLAFKAYVQSNADKNFHAITQNDELYFPYPPPPWQPVLGRKLIESELALQWAVVGYLESRGLREDRNRILKALKQSLLASTEALESTKFAVTAGILNEGFYGNLTGQRQAIVRLLKEQR